MWGKTSYFRYMSVLFDTMAWVRDTRNDAKGSSIQTTDENASIRRITMSRRITVFLALSVPILTVALLRDGASSEGVADEPTPVASSTSVTRAEHKPTGKNWPIFRGDQIATGVAKGTLPENLDVVWKFEVENGAFEGTPAIVDGIAYIGDLDGEVYALDLKTGTKKWTYETESGFIASPAVKDGLLYIGDYDGRLHCLDIKDGKLKWAFESNAEIDACVNFYKENIVFGSQDATLYCLNAKSGKLAWKHEINDQIRCSPTIVGNRTFVAGCDSLLHVIDLDKGEEVANVPIESPTMATPAVLGDHVFFGTEGGAFFSVNWKGDAKIDWTFADERASQPFRSSAAVTKDRVVFGGRTKKVYALNPSDGKEVWHFATRQRVDCSPVIVGNRVFVGASDGRLYGLDLKNGDKLWEFEASGGFSGSPAVADGRMVIATDRGVVYCFGAKEK
jgi:outer membrane protein assembly factor BamB